MGYLETAGLVKVPATKCTLHTLACFTYRTTHTVLGRYSYIPTLPLGCSTTARDGGFTLIMRPFITIINTILVDTRLMRDFFLIDVMSSRPRALTSFGKHQFRG